MRGEYVPPPGTPVEDLDTPALLIDLDAAEANIAKLQAWCDANGTAVRPHAKTHKSALWGQKQIDAGAIGLCASKVSEAEVLADGGIRELLVTSQIVGWRKIARLMGLAARANLTVAVDSPGNVRELSEAAQSFGRELGVVIEVNVGQNRCGVESGRQAAELARVIDAAPGLRFDGVMGYEGHVVAVRDYEERKSEGARAAERLLEAVEAVESAGIAVNVVTAGGTGTYNIAGAVGRITDIQPGSYIFMDGDYLEVMDDFRMALTVLATVVSRPVADRVVLDAGRKSVSIDRGMPSIIGVGGEVRLSEEHLVMDGADDAGRRLRVGDRVQVLPMHGDTTTAQHDEYFCVRSGRVEAVVEIAGRGKFR